MMKTVKKHYNTFNKYLTIGVIFTIYEIALFWFFVDHLNLNTLIWTIIITGSSTVFKFYAYVVSKMMKKDVMGYLIVLGIFYVVNVALMWILVEIFGVLASVSSGILAVVLFVLRYAAYDKLKMLRN